MVPGSTHRYLSLAGFALVAALGSCGLLNCDTALRASILSLPFSPSAHAGADGWSLSASIASSPALGYGYLAMVVLTVVAYARVWGSNVTNCIACSVRLFQSFFFDCRRSAFLSFLFFSRFPRVPSLP